MILKGTILQGGVDTFTAAQILTGLTVDGKSGWQINSLKAFWSNGHTAAAADAQTNLVLATIATVTTPATEDEIARISWGVQNTAGVAVAFSFDPIKKADITEPRLTVQSDLYIHAASSGTGLANNLNWELSYEIVKLSDIEVLRLAVGGA